MKALVALIVATVVATGTAHAEIKKGDHFVELEARAANGKAFKLKSLTGKWVVLSFNASWCQPCRKELPALEKVASKLAGKVIFVAANIDSEPVDGKEFIESLKLHCVFPVFMPNQDSAGMKAYDPDRMPSTFVIDPTGTIQYVAYGFTKGDETKLTAHLAELTK